METPTPTSQEESSQPTRSPLGWLWFFIPVLAISTLVFSWQQTENVPTENDWSPALSILEKEIKKGDGVYIYPTWYAAPWSEIDNVLSSKKIKDRDALIHAHPLTLLERMRYPRIWMLAPYPEDLPEPLNQGENKTGDDTVGLFLLKEDPVETRYDFRKELRKAQIVRFSPEGKESPCRWRKDRHRCDKKQPFTDVRSTVGEVGNTRREAIAAHAWPNHGTLRITYKDIPLGNSLVVGAGLALRSVRIEQKTPATFRVLVNGKRLHEQILPSGDFGWHVNTVETTPGNATVVFEIATPEAHKRLVYFDALAVK